MTRALNSYEKSYIFNVEGDRESFIVHEKIFKPKAGNDSINNIKLGHHAELDQEGHFMFSFCKKIRDPAPF